MPDGSIANGNHELIEVITDSAQSADRQIADADSARELMAFR